MKIAVIHGSSKDNTTDTNVMVTAFLKGAQAAVAEIYPGENKISIKNADSSNAIYSTIKLYKEHPQFEY